MSFFGFGQSVEVEIVLSDAESRKRAEHKTEDGKKEKYFLFYDGETVSGKVSLALKHPNKRLEHQGIKIEFIGQIGKSALRTSLPGCICQPGVHSGGGRGFRAALLRPVGAPKAQLSEARPPVATPELQSSLPKETAPHKVWVLRTPGASLLSQVDVGTLSQNAPVVPSTCSSVWLPAYRILE